MVTRTPNRRSETEETASAFDMRNVGLNEEGGILMKKHRFGSKPIFVFYFLVFLFAYFGFQTDTNAEKNTGSASGSSYILAFEPVEGMGGISGVEIMDAFNNIANDLSKKTGIKIILKNIGRSGFEEQFIKGKADFAFFGIDLVFMLRQANVRVEPVVLASMFKTRNPAHGRAFMSKTENTKKLKISRALR